MARTVGRGFESAYGVDMTDGVDTDDPQERMAQALSSMHPVQAVAGGREVPVGPSPVLCMHLNNDTWKSAATERVLTTHGSAAA